MTENEVLFQISNLANGHLSFAQAVEHIALLLECEAEGKGLLIHLSDQSTDASDILRLFDSFDQPYRSLYIVDLLDSGKTLGKVTVCFASSRFHGLVGQRLADFVGQQLGLLLARTRLAEHRAKLKSEIEEIERDLAARKVMQRAEGILVAQRGMSLAAAKRWIARQSQRTGLGKTEIAGRVISYHQATGLFGADRLEEQRIA